MSENIRDAAGDVGVEGNVVIIDGPGAILASLTPDVAQDLGQKLIDAAARAFNQPPISLDSFDPR